jgi:hypothetical protein
MPENENEIVIEANPDDMYFLSKSKRDESMKFEYEIANTYSNYTKSAKKVKIVGIKYLKDSYDTYFYVDENLINFIKDNYINDLTLIKYTFLGNEYTSYDGGMNELVPSTKVPKGKAIVSFLSTAILSLLEIEII